MAPRGRRPRKPRLTRMDAAIDAMVPFGFPDDLVRRKVKNLLKEYGGDEGWSFIEGEAYKLLIETILDEQENQKGEEIDDQEKSGEEGNLLKNDSNQEERAGDTVMEDAAGPSEEVLPLACSEDMATALRIAETEYRDQLPSEIDGKAWKDVDLDRNCGQKGSPESKSEDNEHLDSTIYDSSTHVVPSLPPIKNVPTRRVKPCYGWISSDEEEDDFIDLTPAVQFLSFKTIGQPENVMSGLNEHPKRRRWDVRPEVA